MTEIDKLFFFPVSVTKKDDKPLMRHFFSLIVVLTLIFKMKAIFIKQKKNIFF